MTTLENVIEAASEILEQDIVLSKHSELQNLGLNSVTFIRLVVAIEKNMRLNLKMRI